MQDRKKIGILTTTRAEYGLLKTLYNRLAGVAEFEISMLVTGTHLLEEYGYTVSEIENDEINVAVKILVNINSENSNGICCAMADVLKKFSEHFSEYRYDILIVLGDRYETLSVCIAAMNHKIPIAHIHGGETTEGAIDEAIRHSITKMSYLHFTSMEEYKKRVIQLGENPKRVFNVGALGIENIFKNSLMTKAELEQSINFGLGKEYGVMTYHPVTLEQDAIEEKLWNVLHAIEKFPEMKFIITKANSDAGGKVINQILETFAEKRSNILLIDSLGTLRYLSALKYCAFVIGNSSSGIIEAPSLGIPTINVGDRQRGRIQAESIYNVSEKDSDAIEQTIRYVLTSEIQLKAKRVKNPYGDGKTSEKIKDILLNFFEEEKIDLKKKFYDL